MPEYILQPFVMSILLSISETFEDDAIAVIHSAILRRIGERNHAENSAWVRKMMPNSDDPLSAIDAVILNW